MVRVGTKWTPAVIVKSIQPLDRIWLGIKMGESLDEINVTFEQNTDYHDICDERKTFSNAQDNIHHHNNNMVLI